MKRILSLITVAMLLIYGLTAVGVIAEEKKEPDVFTAFIEEPTDVLIEGNRVAEWFEQLANVKFDFIVSTGDEMKTLMLSTGDYPELFLTGFNNNDIINYGMASEIFVPIEEYIDEHAPNIKAYLDTHEVFRKNITAPDGHIYGVPTLPASLGHGQIGAKGWINTEWLKRLDLEMPTTTEELYNVLVAFRDRDPNGNGIKDEIPFSGCIKTWDAEPEYFLMNSFIFADKGHFITIENGEVKFAATDDRYREGLEYIKKLYDEGLLDPACFTQDLDQLIQLGQNPDIEILGAFSAGHVGMALNLEDIERSKMYGPLVTPEGPNGERFVKYHNPQNTSGTAFAITDICHDVPRALEIIDMMYDEVVSVTGEYGPQGEQWDFAEPGMVDFEGNQALYMVTGIRKEQSTDMRDNYFGTLRKTDTQRPKYAVISDDIYDPNSQQYELRLVQATNEYLKYKPEETLPVIWADKEAAEQHAQLSVAIVEYVKQATTRFITGDMNIDTEWDAYVSALNGMGLEQYVQYYIDGYNAAKAK
jgi:putative aldouronate transport system substrate-binding protein